MSFEHSSMSGSPLPTVNINQLLPADSGRIWLAAYSTREVGIFDPDRFTYEPIPMRLSSPLPARSEFKMWQDGYGRTYINVLRYGKILVFDAKARAFTENTPLNNLPAGWKPNIDAVHDLKNRRYWITSDSGLCVYDESSRTMWSRHNNPRQLALLDQKEFNRYGVSQIKIDSKQRLWIFSWQHAQIPYCYNESGQPLTDTAGLTGVNTSYQEMHHTSETSDGTIWIYGAACLYIKEPAAQFALYRKQYIDNYGIRYGVVSQVYEDRDGVTWIATDQGLYYNSPIDNSVINMYLSDKPGELPVTDITQLSNGHYWLSTWGAGIICFDQKFKRYDAPLYKNMPPMHPATRAAFNLVWCAQQHSTTGYVYLGCQGGAMMVHDQKKGTTAFSEPPVFDHSTIRYITEDPQRNLWFGTQRGRVIRYDGKTWKVMLDLGLGATIYKVMPDKGGWIWVATQDKGVYALRNTDGAVMQHYDAGTGPNQIFNASANDLEALGDSLIFAATGALNIINKKTGRVRQVTISDGLPSNAIQRVRLDAEGFLWIMTDNGLCRFDYSRNLFTTYGKKDGILLGETASKADYLCSDKYVMFAGENSLLFFHPSAFKSSVPPPDVTITDFHFGNQFLLLDSLLQRDEIVLGPTQNNFGIRFSCLDFRNRDKYIYYYRIKGLDNRWTKADGMELTMTGLAPGRYTFEWKAESIDGLSSRHITTMRIRVKPPFWRTGWFISTLLMLISMTAYGMHRLRLNRLMAVEKIRNRVARDLHDDMGSTLSTINILSSIAKTKMHTDQVKAVEFINKISDNSQRMMDAMDDIVWAIKPSNDSMEKVIARLREFATNALEAKDIELHFEADASATEATLDMEARRDFFLIGKEAINNAAKYSKASKATVKMAMQNNMLMLTVEDNGIGFDVNTADGGNGLGNMQRRAASLKGKLNIRSAPVQGTTLTLTVPVA